MKNASKNKFFLCFRPVVDIDVMLDSRVAVDHSPSGRFSCVSVAHKDEITNSDTKSTFSDKGCLGISENSVPPKRKLSRVIKAMVFETILNRKARRKNRFRQDSCGSNSSYSTYTEETSSTGDEKSIWSQTSVDTSSIQEINSESQFSSCSSESKLLCKSKSYPSEAKHRKRSPRDPLEKKRKKSDCSGIYLLLLSLTLTVLWGKILGIMLTSIWLYSYSVFKARYFRPKRESKVCKNRSHRGRLQ